MLGSAIRELVLVKLEEHSPFGDNNQSEVLLSGGDILSEVQPIYSYVDNNLKEAAHEMLNTIPLHRTTSFAISDTTAVPVADTDDNLTGRINLPQNYLRLHTLQMQGWKKPVNMTIGIDHPLYSLQLIKYDRGTYAKPVVVDDGVCLHYYSLRKSADNVIKTFIYVPKFDVESETIEYPTEVGELIALNCARKVYELFGNTEQMKIMQEEIQNCMQLMN